MGTTYTKINDISTGYTEVSDISSTYTKSADQYTQNKPFGGLLKLATEGKREPIMNEDRSTFIVVSKGSDGIDYTKQVDITTAYTKINDI
jgi:hypothetical protein